VGTTDTDYEGSRDEPRVDEADVDYLLGEANKWLAKPLSRDDVIGIYAGLRPLLATGAGSDGTATLSREHAVLRPAPGMVLIAGGKYTTYRVMAADAVDAAVTARAETIIDVVPESRTDELPLVGAAGYPGAWASRDRLAREAGLSRSTIEHLLRRHGDRTGTVLDLVADDATLGEPIHPEAPYLRAEAVVAVTREGALGLDDILVRRTRVALETRGGGADVAQQVAELVAPLLGWDEDRIAAEVERVRSRRDALQPVPGGHADQQEVIVAAEFADEDGELADEAESEDLEAFGGDEFAAGVTLEPPRV
jgi:glycerol-3-phosphate dehydrogenase